MNTDKTLADVQPGGRVRLGDQAERARFEAFLSANPLKALCAGTAWEVWQAALSAQPSPGGQEDAPRCFVSLDMLAGSRHKFGEVFDHPQGSFVRYEDHVRALAARQTVGEPVPFAVESKAFETHAASRDLNLVQHPLHYLFLDPVTVEARRAWKAALAFAQPAQAVDLGQFRDAVAEWRSNWANYGRTMTSAGRDTSKARRNVDEADRLLALIDSQAVGK